MAVELDDLSVCGNLPTRWELLLTTLGERM
jgi:hypothetical protein